MYMCIVSVFIRSAWSSKAVPHKVCCSVAYIVCLAAMMCWETNHNKCEQAFGLWYNTCV